MNRALRPVGAAIINSTGEVEVFDGAAPAVVRLARDGHVRERTTMPGVVAAIYASRTANAWYVVASAGDRLALYRVREGSPPRRLFTFTEAASHGGIPQFRLSTAGGDALITELTAPFRVFRIDSAGHSTQLGEALHLSGDDRPAALNVSDAYWASLPTIQLGSEYLQTLVDVRSDRRVMMVYNEKGTQVRVRALAARLTPVAASPDHTLLALRQLSGTEVVGYVWTLRG